MDYPFTRQAPVNTGANLVLLGFPRTEIIESAEFRTLLDKVFDKKMSNESVGTSFAPNRTSFEISNYEISANQFHTTY
jgi:hypothetical protein